MAERPAQPLWFDDRPEMACAVYGHRRQLYRESKRYMGHCSLQDWGRVMSAGYVVVTSKAAVRDGGVPKEMT